MTRQTDPSATGTDAHAAQILLAAVGAVIASGLTAAGRQPRLLGLLDQHAAAVRDSLDGDRRPLSLVALARYAQGVRDAAADHGWLPPEGQVDWTAGDWVPTRLLAVYALARRGWPALG